jgi:hypothetical protein
LNSTHPILALSGSILLETVSAGDRMALVPFKDIAVNWKVVL